MPILVALLTVPRRMRSRTLQQLSKTTQIRTLDVTGTNQTNTIPVDFAGSATNHCTPELTDVRFVEKHSSPTSLWWTLLTLSLPTSNWTRRLDAVVTY